MRCSICGARLLADACYCHNCGRKLSEAEKARLQSGGLGLFGRRRGKPAHGGVHTGPVWLNDGWHQGLAKLRREREDEDPHVRK